MGAGADGRLGRRLGIGPTRATSRPVGIVEARSIHLPSKTTPNWWRKTRISMSLLSVDALFEDRNRVVYRGFAQLRPRDSCRMRSRLRLKLRRGYCGADPIIDSPSGYPGAHPSTVAGCCTRTAAQ